VNPTGWSEAPSNTFGATLITQAVKYAGASGDFNPLHHDLETARRAGFDAIVVHGSLNAARLAHVLAIRVGVEGLSEFAVRFERPALLGEPLAAAWRRADDVVDMTLFREDTGQQAVSAQARYGGWSLDPDGPGDYRALGDPYPWPVELGAARFFDEAVSGEAARPENGCTISIAFVGTCIRWTPAKESVVRRLGFDFSRMLHGSSWFQLVGEPIRIGETLLVTEAHGNWQERPHRSGGVMRMADAILDIRDAGGKRRARLVQRLLERPKIRE
jgi:3-hydroxybutyryl-CoA dehydratase